MLKLLLLLFICVSLQADYNITNIDKNSIITIQKTAWPVGTSGIIFRKIGKDYEIILKRVEVIASKERTKLKVFPFNNLLQGALPTLKTSIALNDLVRLGWMHNRVLIIAPTKNSYILAKKLQKNKIFISSDLLTALLIKNNHNLPSKEDIQKFCNTYDIGIINFVINKKLFKVDAKSFKTLKITDMAFKKNRVQLPFYDRIKEINLNISKNSSSAIKYYNNYYLKLLKDD